MLCCPLSVMEKILQPRICCRQQRVVHFKGCQREGLPVINIDMEHILSDCPTHFGAMFHVYIVSLKA